MLDYMTQETIKSLRANGIAGPSEHGSASQRLFPEYIPSSKEKSKADLVFKISERDNAPDLDTPRTFRHQKSKIPSSNPESSMQPFTIPSLLLVPHLAELAILVVESEVRKEERRRRRRIRDGVARPRDLQLEQERCSRGLDKKEWRISEAERRFKMVRLAEWVIRNIAEEGSLVQIKLETLNSPDQSFEYGFLPLPPQLLLPLLVPHLQMEQMARKNTFMRKTDPRWGSGMTVGELGGKLRGWGEEGRWERVGEWKVEEALQWGEEMGSVERVGKGWWAVEGKG